MENWYGFRLEREKFEDRELISVFPEKPNGRWVLKTEYFGAFPKAEIELVKKGYHLFHLQSITRWHKDEDTEARARLCGYVSEKYGLSKKCVVVGMSCGGMQGIYLGAKHPECVSCLYLDAPVVNLLSCPAGLGKAGNDMMGEFEKAKDMSLTDLLSYREHPLDYIPALVKTGIPVIMVAGDSDKVVPYDENGILLEKAYKEAGCVIETYIKEGCDHHPHSLDDVTPILDFIEKYDID